MKKKRESSYLESFKEYQDKMYLPGYYVGGKFPPYLLAKTKAGGYFLIFTGIISFVLSIFLFVSNQFSIENLGVIIWLLYAILAIIVGIKFIKLNKHNK